MTRVLMVRHRHRPNAITSAVSLAEALEERGIDVVDDGSGGDIDMVLSIGGDGTFLVAASSARALNVPLLGINAGHMGFLTELGDRGPSTRLSSCTPMSRIPFILPSLSTGRKCRRTGRMA